jgi:hypothetical protein
MPIISAHESDPEIQTFGMGWDDDFCHQSDEQPSYNPSSNTQIEMDAFGSYWDDDGLTFWPDDETQFIPDKTTETDTSPRTSRRPNKIRKGYGKDSKTRRPDPWDHYVYESPLSPSFCSLRRLGYKGISLDNVRKAGDMIEQLAEENGIELLPRNRVAHRRKPCAFHWFDQNWPSIARFYESTLLEILGDSEGVKKRGRKPKPKLEDSVTSNE